MVFIAFSEVLRANTAVSLSILPPMQPVWFIFLTHSRALIDASEEYPQTYLPFLIIIVFEPFASMAEDGKLQSF